MIISNTETKFVQKTWGSETWMVNTEKFCGKILKIEKGKHCSLHFHKLKEENFYILKGIVHLEIGTSKTDKVDLCLAEGDSVLVKAGVLHRFTGVDDDNQVIETSTQHFDDDSYRIEPSYGS